MTDAFAIELRGWIEGGAGPESSAATMAEIAIRVGDRVATELEDRRAQTVREYMRGSAYALAVWFAASWWRLRWEEEPSDRSAEWCMSHELIAAGEGHLWPPVTFASEGDVIRVTCNPTNTAAPAERASVRYLNAFDTTITTSVFETAIDNFVDVVLTRLIDTGVDSADLRRLWIEIGRERRDVTLARTRRLEARLGVDPEADISRIAALQETWLPLVGPDALDDIAVPGGLTGLDSVLRGVQAAASRTPVMEIEARHTLAEMLASEFKSMSPMDNSGDEIFEDVRTTDSETPIYKLGSKAAQRMRKLWSVNGRPLTGREFDDCLGVSSRQWLRFAREAPVATGIQAENPDQFRIAFRGRYPTSRRFEIARIFGDAVLWPSKDRWRPASDSKSARQKFQRAFAAELLMPREVVNERLSKRPSEDEIEALASDFEVSSMIVRHHAENQGFRLSGL